MSRLFANTATIAEIERWFETDTSGVAAVPRETIEGNAGLVVIEHQGQRFAKALTWGFPRLSRDMRLRGDPPGRLGLVADLTNPMWEHIVVEPRYRCLIALTHFANPDGDPGEKTRTWFSRRDAPIMAWAGFCRNTPEFGPVFAGMTMTANTLVMPFNDRMPVLLEPSEFDAWLRGPIQDVIGFQFRVPLTPENMTILHTNDRWKSGKLPPATQSQMAFL